MAAAGSSVCAWLVSTSDLARSALGSVTRLSVSVSVLSPGVGSVPLRPSSAIEIVSTICVVPAVTGSSTRTAKVRLPPVPAARSPIATVQIVPPVEPSGPTTRPSAGWRRRRRSSRPGRVSVITHARSHPDRRRCRSGWRRPATSPARRCLTPSSLVMTRSGPASIVSTSVAVLLGVGSGPALPSSCASAVLVRDSTPAGSGLSTWTVTVRKVLVDGARSNVGQVTTPSGKRTAVAGRLEGRVGRDGVGQQDIGGGAVAVVVDRDRVGQRVAGRGAHSPIALQHAHVRSGDRNRRVRRRPVVVDPAAAGALVGARAAQRGPGERDGIGEHVADMQRR